MHTQLPNPLKIRRSVLMSGRFWPGGPLLILVFYRITTKTKELINYANREKKAGLWR